MKFHWVLLLSAALAMSGCSWFKDLKAVRSQGPEESESESEEENRTRLVGDLAVPFNMFPLKVETVGLVSGLHGTGSDPKPSPNRSNLIAQMQARGVNSPNSLLASGNVSLVLVRGVLRPGIQKGDRFDLEVRVPSDSETTSLRGGWLMEVDMKENALLADNQLHDGRSWGRGEGAVLVDPAADAKKDRVLTCRGQVLSGGVCQKSRTLGLVLKTEKRSAFNAARIETVVNRRFHTFQKGVKTGVAKARTDQYLELAVHPRYKDNTERYVQVVRAIALRETETEQIERLALLEKQLLDPISASRAALQLEAIGPKGADVLRRALKGGDRETRFYAAEALAYLDESGAAETLAATARDLPAFRVYALAALSASADFNAHEQLQELLDVPSAETRYGAFRSLWAMNARDPLVMGEALGGQFSYHVLNTSGPPMIHVTKSRRPEVVLFGQDQRIGTPLAVNAGNQIMITSTQPGEISVSKFAVNQPDQKRFVSNRLDEVIRAIVELGGTYPDVVQFLQEAKVAGVLQTRFEVEALPEAGRSYDRTAQDSGDSSEEADEADDRPTSPMPDLFGRADSRAEERTKDEAADVDEETEDSEKKPGPVKGFFAKITGRKSE
jgi:flagellar basal body P-ring protein FlgI